MIIQIVGTNSSGKTEAVRRLLALGMVSAHYQTGRKRAAGHILNIPEVSKPIWVAGAYDEIQTSGMDTFHGVGAENYDLIVSWASQYDHVIFEGIRMMIHTRGLEMAKKIPHMRVLFLNTPKHEIFSSLEARRAANGLPPKGYNAKEIEGNIPRARNYTYKLSQLGCPVREVTRETVVPTMLELLKS